MLSIAEVPPMGTMVESMFSTAVMPLMEMPKGGGDTFNLLTLLMYTQQAAQDCYLYAREAEANGNKRLTAFYGEMRETQSQLVGRIQEIITQP